MGYYGDFESAEVEQREYERMELKRERQKEAEMIHEKEYLEKRAKLEEFIFSDKI